MSISFELLEVLVCPKCKGKLSLSDDGSWLSCSKDGIRFPVRDGIPVMLIDEAEAIS